MKTRTMQELTDAFNEAYFEASETAQPTHWLNAALTGRHLVNELSEKGIVVDIFPELQKEEKLRRIRREKRYAGMSEDQLRTDITKFSEDIKKDSSVVPEIEFKYNSIRHCLMELTKRGITHPAVLLNIQTTKKPKTFYVEEINKIDI